MSCLLKLEKIFNSVHKTYVFFNFNGVNEPKYMYKCSNKIKIQINRRIYKNIIISYFNKVEMYA